ncbi:MULTISPECIES: hypothetical protein [Bradyrhizobium]|uniref:Uncharacterized protein n=1 Tax=Bradyrhizobium yuanmingense TaxID=108015 RepID=A0ABV4GMM7_9BRAD|nr:MULTISPECIES: hypothetical protein [Bradyrhizobium]MDA9527870.1 hypothetical protein [Bradyrhizobium sp. CCBAU 25338]
MLDFIRAGIEDYSTWLIVFRFIGLAIAAGSSIWATVSELTVKEHDGRKRLTRSGVIAIGLTISGLVVSIVFEDLQRRNAAREQAARVIAEAQRTNEVILATQPLTSAVVQLQFSSANDSLRKAVMQGKREIRKNANESQGGSTPIPLDAMDYDWVLLPIVSFLAHPGTVTVKAPPEGVTAKPESRKSKSTRRKKRNDKEEADEGDDRETERAFQQAEHAVAAIVLIPLDDAQNTVLSFGKLSSKVEFKKDYKISAGFAPFEPDARKGYSVPRATYKLAAPGSQAPSTYDITWKLDPGTLTASIDRQNPTVTPTGRTRKTLQIAIFYDMERLPFSNYDFSRISIDELWTEGKPFRNAIEFGKEIMDASLTLEVNGAQELPRRYRLKRMFSVDVDQDDMGPGMYKSGCTLLEFDSM